MEPKGTARTGVRVVQCPLLQPPHAATTHSVPIAMSHTPKKHLPRLIGLVVTLSLTAAAAPTVGWSDDAAAQGTPRDAVGTRLVQRWYSAFPQPAQPDRRVDPTDNAPPLDFWIVSSRRCPQSGEPDCTPDQFDYFHVGPDKRAAFVDLRQFRRSIRPDVPVCVVVHGSYTPWSSLLRESVDVYRWIRSGAPGQPLQVVFYSWPSEPPTMLLPHVDIAVLGTRATFNGFYLAQLVQQLPENAQVSFYGHSHGARVLGAALHLLDGGEVGGYRLRAADRGNRRLRPVFAAAAIDHHWLNPNERFGRALNQVERGMVLFNRDDLALNIYPLRRLFSHRPLGLVGFDRLDFRLQNGRAAKLVHLDVTELIDTGHFWKNYSRRPVIARAMAPLLFFNDSPSRLSRASDGSSDTSNRGAGENPRPGVIRHSSSTIECTVVQRRS